MEELARLHSNSCIKNPGRKSFIPSSKFNVKHLPLPYRDIDLANFVTSMIDLSVIPVLKCRSESRPAFIPSTKFGFPCGSGYVHRVYKFPDRYNFQHKTCPCKECLTSEIPNSNFACIVMGTSMHVGLNDPENITCYLFHKKDSRYAACSNIIKLDGMWRVVSDLTSDCWWMIHVTHDMELASRLDRMVLYRDYLKEKYVNKCLLYNPPEKKQNDHDLLAILVSHPHGWGSYVSIGFVRGTEDRLSGRIKYTYDLKTCLGSTGGKIFVVWKDWKLWGFEHTHSRRLNSLQKINCSSSGIGFLSPIQSKTGNDRRKNPANSEPEQDAEGNNRTEFPKKSEMEQETEGLAEVEECLAEIELDSKFMKCPKNPGHKNFIPMHKFNEDHLPPGSRHLVEPIKALGNITALVAVKQVSEERPATYPGTGTSYVRNAALFGTCWVYKVIREEGRCQCEECKKSNKPRNNFAYIIIHTAAHVVFDNSEGKHTTCYLFFDKGRNVASCEGVVQLSGMSRVWSDAEKDVSKMVYVTHDPDVIDCVENAVHEWESARKSLEGEKFIGETVLINVDITSPYTSLSADVEHAKLAITVSHPHGCSKQVSIGECVSVDGKGNGHSVYNYTTPTCHGCSGSYVFVEGRVRNSWDDHVNMGVDIVYLSYSN